MKRVLNSGIIKLPYLKGNEIDGFTFTFEIKAPLLTFLAFQDSNLGTLKRLDELDHPVAYLPPQFYTKDATGYTSMDGKNCNVYTTKLFNFYTAAFNFYNNLLREGMCKEEADLILPQGVFINFIWEITSVDLIDYIEKYHADSPEIYGYCTTFVLYLKEHMLKKMQDLKANQWKNFSL